MNNKNYETTSRSPTLSVASRSIADEDDLIDQEDDDELVDSLADSGSPLPIQPPHSPAHDTQTSLNAAAYYSSASTAAGSHQQSAHSQQTALTTSTAAAAAAAAAAVAAASEFQVYKNYNFYYNY